MSGVHLTGTGECIDLIPNVVLASKNTGAMNSTVKFTFLSKDIQTKVTLSIDYQVPSTLLGHLAEIIILKMNDKEAELILDNLRILFEKS